MAHERHREAPIEEPCALATLYRRKAHQQPPRTLDAPRAYILGLERETGRPVRTTSLHATMKPSGVPWHGDY